MSHWVSVWGNAMSIAEGKPEQYAKDITLRYPIHIGLSGKALRIKMDNFTGQEAIAWKHITIARQTEHYDFEEETMQTVLWNGAAPHTLAAGEAAISDPIDCRIQAGETWIVSIYFESFTQMRCGVTTTGPLSKAAYALHDQTSSAIWPSALSKEITWTYFLSQIDLLTDDDHHAMICYGDSITAQAWMEYLQLQLIQQHQPVALVRRAVCGSRILRQYDCLMYESYGLKGAIRFPHEADGEGITGIILLQGINDIIHPVGEDENPYRPWSDLPTAEELIDGIRQYIIQAKQRGYAVYLGTILPVKGWRTYAPFREELRQAVNAWIRNQTDADRILDFDRLLRDPDDPLRLLPLYDSGDHLHPSDTGHREMARFVYDTLFSNR